MAQRLLTAVMIIFFGLCPVTASGKILPGNPSVPVDEAESFRSILTVDRGEIDLGVLAPGEGARGTFSLKSVGAGNPEWFAETPKGWRIAEGQNLSALIDQAPLPLQIHLAYVRETGTSKNRGCSLTLRLAAGVESVLFRREAPLGDLREEIRFHYYGGTISVFFNAKLVEMAPLPRLELEPLRLDFGTFRPGEQITKKILLKNRGRESLKWKAGVAGGRGMPSTAQVPAGKYISLRNEVSGTGLYSLGGKLQEGGFEISGNWTEKGGYPSGQDEQSILRYRFTGTGIGLYFWKTPDGGPFSVFLDDQFVSVVDGYAERRERAEPLIIERQLEGPHQLTVMNGTGKVVLEGVRVFGKPVQKGPRGWISLFPDSGFTTRETDYINVSLNTRQLAPGIYWDRVLFLTNGGDADVEVFLEIAAETAPRFLDVHRYLAGSDYLFTTNPQAEASGLQAKGYQHTGVAFRIFAPGTPGTTEFFRWFNPAKGDHYYSYDPKGGKPLPGYLLEGAIGNIATSRLSGTRELYRWFNPTKGGHFYTTDQAGEGMGKKGYRFDGIAGFVR